MITNLVSRILGGSSTGNLNEESELKLSDEHSIYCSTSLTTFYRPKRLKIAILEHIPCRIDSLNIELIATQKSGNFKEYILSNIHDVKRSKIPRQILIMNGYSFYSIISSSKQSNCSECGSCICSSVVIDFTRNADNGESTYLIFQGEMILRIYDRKSGLNIYCLSGGKNTDDIIRITREEVILSIPNSFIPSMNFRIDLILYSAIGWIRKGDYDFSKNSTSNIKIEDNCSDNDFNSKTQNFTVSNSQNLSICNEKNKRVDNILENNKNFDSDQIVNTPINQKKLDQKDQIEIEDQSINLTDDKKKNLTSPNSNSTPLSSIMRAKAPPLPLHMKSAPRSKNFSKGSFKDSPALSCKKKVLPLGRRIHWKPLSEEMAQKTIFREILYTSLNTHSQSPSMSPQSVSNSSSSSISSIEDLCKTINNSPKGLSPTSNSASPVLISDIHIANTLVHMETLSRVFTKSNINGNNNSVSPSISSIGNTNVSSINSNSCEILNTSGDKRFLNKDSSNSLESAKSKDQNLTNNLNLTNNQNNNSNNNPKVVKDEQNNSYTNSNVQKQLPLTFLSQKRAQNMAIVLARLSVPTDYIIELLKSFNISSLTLEDYERIEQVLPTEVELEKIKNHPKKELHQLEQFLSRFSHISNPMTRLRFLKFEHILDASEFDVQKNLNTLYSASIQMRNSSKLRLILKAFLLLGNYVNHGINFSNNNNNNMSSISQVANNGSINWSLLETKGFSLSSLLRLVEFKTTIDPSFTALHYIIANLTLSNPNLNLIQFSNDLQAVSEASKISVEALFIYINDMRKELAVLEIEKKKFSNDRVEHLFESYTRRLDALVEGYHRIVEKVVDTALYFGQTLPEGNKAAIIQPFFETMNIFLLQFSSCCKEIREKPLKFTPLLVNSSIVFPSDRNFSNQNSFNSSKSNSTSNSSNTSTPLLNNTPNSSITKLPQVSDLSNEDNHNIEKSIINNQQLPKKNKKGPFSSNIQNQKRKQIDNIVIIQPQRNNNAFQLPNRLPPPKFPSTLPSSQKE